MINKVSLIGFLGADPEIKHLDNGTAVGRFSLATNESFKDKNDEWQTITEWHNIVVWRDLAERAEKNLKKGALVYVDGKISYRKYTDKDGIERNITDIVASTFRGLEKKEGGAENRFPDAEAVSRQQASTEAVKPTDNQAPGTGDDLPF
jgi:single-strand DNA-binding protein